MGNRKERPATTAVRWKLTLDAWPPLHSLLDFQLHVVLFLTRDLNLLLFPKTNSLVGSRNSLLPQKRIEVLYIHSLLGQVIHPFPPSWVTLDHVTPPGPEDRAVVPIAGTQALTETEITVYLDVQES